MIWYILLAIAAIADLVCGLVDAKTTAKDLPTGVAVEGNKVIDFLFGTNKPSLTELIAFNVAQTVLFATVGVVATMFGVWAFAGGAIGGLFATAGKHLVGAANWKYLVAGGNPRPNQSAFQKFVGLLSWQR